MDTTKTITFTDSYGATVTITIVNNTAISIALDNAPQDIFLEMDGLEIIKELARFLA